MQPYAPTSNKIKSNNLAVICYKLGLLWLANKSHIRKIKAKEELHLQISHRKVVHVHVQVYFKLKITRKAQKHTVGTQNTFSIVFFTVGYRWSLTTLLDTSFNTTPNWWGEMKNPPKICATQRKMDLSWCFSSCPSHHWSTLWRNLPTTWKPLRVCACPLEQTAHPTILIESGTSVEIGRCNDSGGGTANMACIVPDPSPDSLSLTHVSQYLQSFLLPFLLKNSKILQHSAAALQTISTRAHRYVLTGGGIGGKLYSHHVGFHCSGKEYTPCMNKPRWQAKHLISQKAEQRKTITQQWRACFAWKRCQGQSSRLGWKVHRSEILEGCR